MYTVTSVMLNPPNSTSTIPMLNQLSLRTNWVRHPGSILIQAADVCSASEHDTVWTCAYSPPQAKPREKPRGCFTQQHVALEQSRRILHVACRHPARKARAGDSSPPSDTSAYTKKKIPKVRIFIELKPLTYYESIIFNAICSLPAYLLLHQHQNDKRFLSFSPPPFSYLIISG